MLIGLNTLKTVSREKAAVMSAWFDGEEDKTSPVQAAVQTAKAVFASVEIRASLKAVSRRQNSVPSLPRHAQASPVATKAAWSPYQSMSNILDPNSRSSRWLASYGMFQQFASTDCFVDMSMTPDGGMSAVLRSPAGFRRTVVCRPDGSVAQRITGPHGEEIIRFNNDGDPTYSYNKADAQLAIA
jgi:hypothetical protein